MFNVEKLKLFDIKAGYSFYMRRFLTRACQSFQRILEYLEPSLHEGRGVEMRGKAGKKWMRGGR